MGQLYREWLSASATASVQPDILQILSVHCPSGYNVAVAVWKPDERKVFVMEDTKDTTAYDLVALGELDSTLLCYQVCQSASDVAVMEQVQPKYIIMSCRAPNDLHARVKEYCQSFLAVDLQ